jgi:transposase InsO family protein
LRNKTSKRRVKAKRRDDRKVATRPNETWAMDFVHDQLAAGTKLRVLTIVDTFSRMSPAIVPRLSFRGADVVDVLEAVCRVTGFPATIRVDQGTEFVSRDLDLWAYQRGVTLDFSRPGKPTDNAFIEAFNGRFRAECLNAHWFLTLPTPAKRWRIGASTTTRNAPMGRSARNRRSCCSITTAQPARRHDEAGKLQPSAIQRSVSEQRSICDFRRSAIRSGARTSCLRLVSTNVVQSRRWDMTPLADRLALLMASCARII